MKNFLENKFIRNLSWIFVGNMLHAIFSFLLNIYAGRVLTNNDYGLINYAASWISFFNAVCTLGLNGIITKEFAENETVANEYLGTAIKLRLCIATISVVMLQGVVAILNPNEPILKTIVLFQSVSLVFSSFDILIYWFRYKSEAKKVAILRLIAFFISGIGRFFVLSTSKNVLAYVVSVTVETVCFGVLLLILYIRNSKEKLTFSAEKAKKMLMISYPFISSAILTTIYGETDKIMLKEMLGNETVAAYSVALTLAGAISIVPSALIEGFRPDVMTFKLVDETFYEKRLRQLYAAVFWISTLFCVFVALFAKDIILILYGEKYKQAIPALALVVWYTTFSYLGAINNLYFVAENKVKWVQILTFFGAVLNIILNLIFIPQIDVMGAALASLLTQFATNFLLLLLFPQLRGGFKILIQGILLHNLK